jgi:DNA adenine methylase
MGSKNRYAKEILPIILKNRKEYQFYIEPFCGGCNVIDKVNGDRIASDINEYLIEMFRALQNGWIPPIKVTEEEYKNVQRNKEQFSKYLVGYIGFNLSYGGKFFGGYGRDLIGKRNYSLEAYKNITKQIPNLKNINFVCGNYFDVPLPENSIIYCDPPYKDTTKYKHPNINYDKFYDWIRNKVLEGHEVFLSEYQAPDDFICLWEKEVCSSLTQQTGSKKNIERLFTYKK